jgi:hypothetical protein
MTDSINNSANKNISLLIKKKRSFFNILKIDNNPSIHKCHFENCKRVFKEKGNLKTHLRTHVIRYKNRLVRDHFFVNSKIAEKLSLPWEISNHIFVIILVKNHSHVMSKHAEKSIADFVGLKFIFVLT